MVVVHYVSWIDFNFDKRERWFVLGDAVCCSDLIHCCPNGYRCDIKENKCEKGLSIKWFEKKLAIRRNVPLKSIEFNSSLTVIQCPGEIFLLNFIN